MKVDIILFSFFIFSGVDSVLCQKVEDFYNDNYFRFEKEKMLAPTKGEIVRFLSGHFYAGKFKGKGSFGEVREVVLRNPSKSIFGDGSEKVAIKKMVIPKDKLGFDLLQNEIAYLWQMCGNKAEGNSNDQADSWMCSGNTVVKYFGCYHDNTYVNIIQEALYKDLNNQIMNDVYKSFDAIKRAKILQLMAKKFEVLHQNKLIHCDIKPENMMSVDENLSDLRIIDLGLAREIDTDAYGGSPIFTGPERIGFLSKAVPTVDIYSLGITFATMENSYKKVFRDVENGCFLQQMTFNCYRKMRKGLVEALAENNLERLVPVMLKAAAYLPINRYQSMAELAEAIGRVIEDLEFLKEQSDRRNTKADTFASHHVTNGRDFEADSGQSPEKFATLVHAKDPHQQVEEAEGKTYFDSFLDFFSDIFKTISSWGDNTITDDNDNVNDIDGFLQRRAIKLGNPYLYTRPRDLVSFGSAHKSISDTKPILKKELSEDLDVDDEFYQPKQLLTLPKYDGVAPLNSIGTFKYKIIQPEKASSAKPDDVYDHFIDDHFKKYLELTKQREIQAKPKTARRFFGGKYNDSKKTPVDVMPSLDPALDIVIVDPPVYRPLNPIFSHQII